jgi:colanic acid/amylovoran biosynthesis glycosyltransferase
LIETIKYRTNQWWEPKAGFILSAVYLSVLLHKVSFYNAVFYFFPALVTILGIGFFGYISNDFFDRKSDLLAKKKNMLHDKSLFQIGLLTFFSLLLAFLPWLVLPHTKISAYLLTAQFALLILYAMPPFRLKERGFIALFADALYAYFIPFILAFYTFSLLGFPLQKNYALYLPLSFWLLLVGVYNLAIHQLEDYENDKKTNTHTWAYNVGNDKALNVTKKYIWTLKMMGFAFFCISLFFYNFYLGAFLLIALLIKLFSIFNNIAVSLHFKNCNVHYLQSINFHYHLWMPYLLLCLLVMKSFLFLSLLLAHFILFNHSHMAWFYQKFIHNDVRKLFSLFINYSIFYFRVIVLREAPEKARREHQQAYQQTLEDETKKKTQPNIVITNQNHNKYTETFVQQHVKNLNKDFYVHYLYGGKLPFIHEKRGSLVGNDLKIAIQQLLSIFLDRDINFYKRNSFAKFLTNNDIKLVLAEFGTVGVEIFELCKAANVPMVVIFYGYDAHHIQFSPKTDIRYLGLFEYASSIICVSKDILNTLEKYGAPSHKLIYLPCAIDLLNFPYTDHSKNPPVFLSVGRFAETKSPHLTILAFNEVLKAIPEARLRMIGKDGGGELFEVCHILVKALKIEDKVEFLGIKTTKEVADEMKNARVFVQHSITTPIHEDKEGTPVSIMEALACGLPVVATNHAGIAELITSGENGILVEEYDYLAMAKAMVRVCGNDDLVYELGEKGSENLRRINEIKYNREILLDLMSQIV